jgi:hypothetical protein
MTEQQKLDCEIAAPSPHNRPPPLTGNERVQRTRERKRQDIIYLGIEVLSAERDALIRIGLLDQASRDNKKAIRKALYQLFETYLHMSSR